MQKFLTKYSKNGVSLPSDSAPPVAGAAGPSNIGTGDDDSEESAAGVVGVEQANVAAAPITVAPLTPVAEAALDNGAGLITLTPVTRAGCGESELRLDLLELALPLLPPPSSSPRPPTPLGDTAIQTPEIQ